MSGLLNDPLFAGAGLLGPGPQAPSFPGVSGLLGGGFRPSANEPFLTRLFGDRRNPLDPRGDAMSALAAGLLRGDLASGLEGANRAFTETEDRNMRRLQNSFALNKSAYEMADLQQKFRDDQESRSVLRDFWSRRGGMPGAGAAPVGGPTNLVNDALPPDMRIGALPATPNYTAAAGGGGVPAKASIYDQYMELSRAYAARGLGAQAQKAAEMAEKYRPKFNTTPQVVRDREGNLINVLVGEDGTVQQMPYGVKPDVSLQDLGGRVLAIDKNTTPSGQSWSKTMTPGEQASNAVAWANNRNATDRLAFERSQAGKPQFHDGMWFVPPNAQNPQGGVIQPQMPEGVTPKLTEVQGNATQFATRMRDASRVLDKVYRAGDGPWPSTVERAGYKPEFPAWVPGGQIASAGIAAGNKLTTPETALQVRQAQDNWLTANLRKESGAAIPKHELEQERAKWFPMPGEGEETAKQKAAARKVAEEAMLIQAGPGAKQIPKALAKADAASGADKPNAGAKAIPLPSMNAKDLTHGQAYTLPNGTVGKWDSMKKRFEVQ